MLPDEWDCLPRTVRNGTSFGWPARSRDVFLYYETSEKTSTVMLIQTQMKSSQAKLGISVTKCQSLYKKPKTLKNYFIQPAGCCLYKH